MKDVAWFSFGLILVTALAVTVNTGFTWTAILLWWAALSLLCLLASAVRAERGAT